MYQFPNEKVFSKYVGLYLDLVEKNDSEFLCPVCVGENFMAEAYFRAATKYIQNCEGLGIGDLDFQYGASPIQDYFVPFLAYGSQKVLEIRHNHQFLDLERRVKDLSSSENDFIARGKYLVWQAIQEQAGLIWLSLYTRTLMFGCSYMSIFEPATFSQWLSRAVLSSFDGLNGKDWKDVRCLFYRYLLYCGFVPVDNQCDIKVSHIPEQEVLVRLADRLITILKLREIWDESELTIKGYLMDEVLNPNAIARHFLNFNNKLQIAEASG